MARGRWVLMAAAPLGLVTLVPLIHDQAAQMAFITPKWWLALVLVGVGLAATLALNALHFPLGRWWAAHLLVVAGTTAIGVAPLVGILGSPQRNQGVIAVLLGAGAFGVGASIGRVPEAARLVLRAMVLTGGVVAVIGAAEWFDLDVLGFGDLDVATRARSTWGGATVLAGYLLVVVPVAAVMTRAADRRWAVTGGSVAGVGTVALILTGTRGAWVAALVSAWILVSPLRPKLDSLRHRSKWSLPLAALATVVVVGLVVVAVPTIGRSTVSGRVDLWGVAARTAVERPLWGSGADTQRIVMPAHIDDHFEREHGSEELHDRAHNVVLDTLITSGVLGLVAFGALMMTIGGRLVRAARSGWVARGLVAGSAGYLVHLLVGVGSAVLDPLVWLLVGMAVALAPTGDGSEEGRVDSDQSMEARWQRSAPARLVGVAVLVLIAAASAVWVGREWRADRELATASVLHHQGHSGEAIEHLDRAADLAPARFDMFQARARARIEAVEQGGPEDLLADALEDLDTALELAADDPTLLIERASVLALLGDLDQARALYDEVLTTRYPSSSAAHLGRGVVAVLDGDRDAARADWERAADLAPHDPRPRQNLERLLQMPYTYARAAVELLDELSRSDRASGSDDGM